MKCLIILSFVFTCVYASEEKQEFEKWSFVNQIYSPLFQSKNDEFLIEKENYRLFMFAYSKGRVDAYREIYFHEKNIPLHDISFRE